MIVNSKYLILKMITGVLPRPLSKAEKKRNTDTLVQVFEHNYSHILSFLPPRDHPTLKLGTSALIQSVEVSTTSV